MPLRHMIESSRLSAIITNPRMADNPIIACNAAFLGLTGYDEAEVLGRNCRFLAGPETDPSAVAMLREAVRTSRPVMTELVNYRKDGSRFRNAVMIAPVFDAQGDTEFFVGSQVDAGTVSTMISSRSDAKARLEQLTDRQQQVLIAMARGQSTKQTAQHLGLAERTIKMHRTALMRALGVRARVEAIRLAIEAGF